VHVAEDEAARHSPKTASERTKAQSAHTHRCVCSRRAPCLLPAAAQHGGPRSHHAGLWIITSGSAGCNQYFMIDLLLLRSLVDYGSGFVVFDSFLALRFLGAVVWPWWGAVAMAAGARARVCIAGARRGPQRLPLGQNPAAACREPLYRFWR
jgi:hypothetical protein